MSDDIAAGDRPVAVWDVAVRIVHWSFVLLLPALWWTYRIGRMDLHQTLGLVMLGLVVFRVYWGVAGGGTARFAGFVRGPAAILAYLRGLTSHAIGHNPLGGWSVVAMLALLATQVASGLFAQDTDGLVTGPLSHLVSFETSERARDLHELGFNILLALVALHVAAVLFYLIARRDNLIAAMLSGRRRVPADVAAPGAVPAWRIVPGVVLAGGVAWWVSLGCPLPG